MKKITVFCLLISAISLANVREFKKDFDKIDKYKTSKQISAGLQEFNYITPSYTYSKDSGHSASVKWGIVDYSYSNKGKSHSIGLSKNLSEIFDTGVILDYYKKMNEFYDLKDKNIRDYNNIVDTYYEYILAKLELQNSITLLDNMNENLKIAKAKYNLGKISKFDYDKIVLNYEYTKLNVDKLKLELENEKEELKKYNISEDKINLNDITIYKIISPNLEKYVNYQNEKIDNQKNIKKYSNLKNDIDLFMPDINVFYSANIEGKKVNHNYGISISKTISLGDNKYIENKLLKDNTNIVSFNPKLEISRYNTLLKILELQEKKYNLAVKDLEISKLKLDLGKIDNLKYMDKLQEVYNQKLELIRSQISLSKYVLERE